LYEKAVKEAVPFFQWHKWIEKTTNSEVIKYLLNKNQTAPTSLGKDKDKVKSDLNQYLKETRRKSTMQSPAANSTTPPTT